jgi:hypothetical protein
MLRKKRRIFDAGKKDWDIFYAASAALPSKSVCGCPTRFLVFRWRLNLKQLGFQLADMVAGFYQPLDKFALFLCIRLKEHIEVDLLC